MAKTKQISLVLCCVLSLFVSSISACYCVNTASVAQKNHCPPPASHENATENHPDSHHSPKVSGDNHREVFSGDNIYSFQQPDECCGIQSAPKIYAKSESVKIQKQSALLKAFAFIRIKLVRQTKKVKTIDFSMPFYLSDSFYNLPPGRAPPAL